jgi:hypothetical protein
MSDENRKLDEKNEKDTVSRKLRNWTETTTIHGIGNIARSSYITVKMLWCIFLIAAITYCVLSIFKSIRDYLEYEVSAQVYVQRYTSIEYPAVTWCNRNPFKLIENKSVYYNFFTNLRKNRLDEKFIQKVINNDGGTLSSYIFMEYMTRRSHYMLNLNEKKKFESSYDIDDMLINCLYYNIPCSKKNFTHFYSSLYGNI